MGSEPSAEDLKASGCSKEQIEAFSCCRCRAEKLRLLQQQRDRLLDSIHAQEEQISNLDYLTHRLNEAGKDPPPDKA